MKIHLVSFRSKTYFLLTVIIVMLLINTIFLGYIFYTSQSNNPSADNQHTVTITDDGFSPQKITISQSESITFINTSQKKHWVASDDHPSHTLYSEFDTKRPLQTGESWSFTFKRAGRFPYHDHLSHTMKGEITVLPQARNSNTTPLVQSDVSTIVNTIVKNEGPKKAWEYFKSQSNNPLQGAHDIAHMLGGELFNAYGVQALDSCDASFAFGCYHGVFEAFIQQRGVSGLDTIINYCRKYHNEVEITCYHGLGHGLLTQYHYDLQPALSECDKLLPPHFREFCYKGVFMENAVTVAATAKKDNPLWPCNSVDTQYKRSCFSYQMLFLTHLFDKTADIEKACSKAENNDLVTECIQGYARQIAQQNIPDSKSILSTCSQMTGTNKNICIIAAAEEMVFQGQPLSRVTNDLCSQLRNDDKSLCEEKTSLQEAIKK